MEKRIQRSPSAAENALQVITDVAFKQVLKYTRGEIELSFLEARWKWAEDLANKLGYTLKLYQDFESVSVGVVKLGAQLPWRPKEIRGFCHFCLEPTFKVCCDRQLCQAHLKTHVKEMHYV